MKTKLYKMFDHWYHGGQVYLYSDTHFADEQMHRLRGISDEEQVKRINAKIGKNDTIIFLGDVTNKDHIEDGLKFIKQIRGYKVLVMGNHDKGQTIYDDYFDEVYSGVLVINEKIILSHEPVNIPFLFNIHGHDHANKTTMPFHKNCCAEVINYTPVSLNKMTESGAFGKVVSIHRKTIDCATDKKMKRLAKNTK